MSEPLGRESVDAATRASNPPQSHATVLRISASEAGDCRLEWKTNSNDAPRVCKFATWEEAEAAAQHIAAADASEPFETCLQALKYLSAGNTDIAEALLEILLQRAECRRMGIPTVNVIYSSAMDRSA